MRLDGLLGGKYVSVDKVCGKLGGVSGHAPPVNFDLVQWDGMDSRYRA